MRRLVQALALFALVPGVAHAEDAIRDATALPESELAKLRGGFVLPGGMTVAIGVVTETRVDTRLVTRTTYALDRGTPQVKVFARQAGADGLSQLSLEANGAAAATEDGSVRIRGSDGRMQVQFSGKSIDVINLAGQAFGSVIANSGNDRSINVDTLININVGGITPDKLGSSAVRIQELALDSTRLLTR